MKLQPDLQAKLVASDRQVDIFKNKETSDENTERIFFEKAVNCIARGPKYEWTKGVYSFHALAEGTGHDNNTLHRAVSRFLFLKEKSICICAAACSKSVKPMYAIKIFLNIHPLLIRSRM